MKTWLLDAICAAVLCFVLALGLWPFHAPRNGVTWLANHNGLRFGSPGTVISSGAFPMTGVEDGTSGSVEVWLQPRRIWDNATFLAFSGPRNPYQFLLRQSDAGLELYAEIRNDPHPAKTASLYVRDVFHRSGPVFLTITSGQHGTAVYTNGVLARTAPGFRLSTSAITGRLVLGDSPGQPDSWSGRLLGLAIYHSELTATQVLRHYEIWTRGKRPAISEGERNVALYLFDERAGNLVHNQASSSVNLKIPEKYLVLDRIFLEPIWKEFSLSRSYWSSACKNIVGFIPLGFCFCACLSAHKARRPALTTVILGTLVSLTIEILQGYLPTRDSGTTDILTNTLGTYIGVTSCRVVSPILAARFPWLPLAAWPAREGRKLIALFCREIQQPRGCWTYHSGDPD